MKRFFLGVSLLLAFCQCLKADDSSPKLQLTPSGRVLIDGALYASPDKDYFKDGMAIPEARLGVKMRYGKWSSWIDVGFAYSKIGLRNMWIQYDFNPRNALRVGNFIQPFGLQSTTTLSLKSTFEQPMAANPFTPGIQLGLMYTHVAPAFLSQTSFHVETAALSNIMNYPQFSQQGYTFLTRFVGRNPGCVNPDAPILQAGISGGFSTPERRLEGDEDVHDGFSLSTNFPTRVTTLTAASAVIGNSMNSFKLTPELLLAYKRIGLESQYFFQQINRRQNLPHYQAQSAYVTLRGIILGGDYYYDSNLGYLQNPAKNTLECVLNYSYTDLSDKRAGILGGRANAISATLNYYFNPYITARLNYFYAHTWGRTDYQNLTVNGFQLRLMVLF